MRQSEIDEFIKDCIPGSGDSLYFKLSKITGKYNLGLRSYPTFTPPEYTTLLHNLSPEEIEYCRNKGIKERT